jgi:protoheme IX farnesyltransferase
MSRPGTAHSAEALPRFADVTDYVALLKPRVMSLVVFTALVGLVRAPGHMHPVLAFAALLSIAIGAGGAGALNMYWDATIDGRMARTRMRPIPAGRVEAGEALVIGVMLSVASVVMLGLFSGLFAASLLAFTIFFYAVVYTMGLKHWTSQNIVIGGAAGALPPMIGWAAASGSVGLESIIMFLITFFWTPPHFWALALLRKNEYARAGIPMLPVVAGEDETRRQILIYSVIVAAMGVAPMAFGFAGLIYGIISAVLGMIFVAFAIDLYRKRRGSAAEMAARRLFAFSVLYLFLLFTILLIEGTSR